jgi:hypothetical protein
MNVPILYNIRTYVYSITHTVIRVILFVSPSPPSPPLSSFLRYLFQDGLARFATEKYSTKTKALKNRFMHLTNYSINKKQEKYEKNDDKDNDMTGSKWSLQALRRCVQERRDMYTESYEESRERIMPERWRWTLEPIW